MRVLVLAPQGRDSALIGDVLGAAGIKAEVCATVSQVAARMREGAGAALIAEEAFACGFSEVAAEVNSQPSWSDFPLILLAEREHARRAARWMGEALSRAAILPRPLTPETLVSVVRVALRSRQRQYQLQALLAAQQQRAAEVLEGIYDGYLSMDWQWRCVYVNQRGAALLNLRSEDMVGANMLEIMPHWNTGAFRERVQSVMETGEPFAVEEWCPLSNRWFDVRCSRSIDGLSIFFGDITQRKEGEEHLRFVINELSHRVKNTLAVIQAIADQTFKTGGDLDSIRGVFQGRLLALAETHGLLTEARWESVELAALVEHSVSHIASCDGSRVRFSGAVVRLTPKAALAIGMTLHELSTNAAKYGNLAADAGSVDIRWRVAGGALVIEWSEEGGTDVVAPTRQGFGTQMIDQAITCELGGEIAREFRPVGLHCLMTLPQELVLAA